MPIIEAKDIIKSKHLLNLGGKLLTKLSFAITGVNKCNQIYDNVVAKNVKGYDALTEVLRESKLQYDCSDIDIERIPKEGPFIIVSNHPFGMAEGVILTHIIASVRPDVKVLANFFLSKIELLKDYWFEVNPYEKNPNLFNSAKSLRNCYQFLEEGHPLLIFPAGEVSTWQRGLYDCEDRLWNQPIMKFIKKAQVPILPAYIHGSNSKIFHFLGKIHWKLRTVRMPREYLNKQNKAVKLRIGLPIPVKEQDRYEDLETYSRVLRLYSYSLQLSYKKLEPAVQLPVVHPEVIAPASKRKEVLSEIEKLRANPETTLITLPNYTVFCAKPKEMPHIMHDIARLREITFRKVGEGTNKSADTDCYDEYFYQLFVWDNEAHKIVGAYRIGVGAEIMKKHGGTDGFYISSLFDFDPKMNDLMSQSLELGRSFIINEYQKKHSSLFALWRGLLMMMLKTKNNYLLGAVSISGKFSAAAKALTIEFIKVNYFDHELASMTKNKEKATFKLIRRFDKDTFKLVTRGDFAMLDSFVQSIDSKFSTPILVRQYTTMLHTRAIGFNVDFHFNNCLDALMYLDMKKIPKKALLMLTKDFEQTEDLKNLLNSLEDDEEEITN
ncbi:MAG: lysophospholipid acyltransferase family protein [Bacteroidales bacterium]|jgi:putative hemolysin|nr:lysophospholipid acyltransferase family protein [Bacteroidales bacterium]